MPHRDGREPHRRDVLRVYQLSRQLARYRENATLLPHIDAMRRVSPFVRSRPVPPEPEPAPAAT